MPDTQRTYAQIMALLADNTAGAVSPQDLRDAFESWRPVMGQLHVPSGGGAAISCPTANVFYEANASAWASSGLGRGFDESAGNGRLTYVGTVAVMVHVALSVSFTTTSTNEVVKIRLGTNGTPSVVAQAERKIGTGSDVGSTAIHWITTMNPSDYVSVWVACESNSRTVTPVVANLQALGTVM